MMDRRHLLALLGASAGLPRLAAAQGAFPTRPVTLVVAFPPGASTDITARRIAPRATAQLGQTLVVENRTGAAGNLAAGFVARAAPDGHTLLHTNYVSLLIAKAANTRLEFDPVDAFAPVAQIGPNVNMLVVRPDLPVRTLPDLVAAAKREPDKLTMGTIGIGSAYHMGLEWLNLAFGMRITHVPYRGAAEAVNDLLGNRIDMMFSSLTLAKPHLEANRMRAIAITNQERAPMFPGDADHRRAGRAGLRPHDPDRDLRAGWHAGGFCREGQRGHQRRAGRSAGQGAARRRRRDPHAHDARRLPAAVPWPAGDNPRRLCTHRDETGIAA